MSERKQLLIVVVVCQLVAIGVLGFKVRSLQQQINENFMLIHRVVELQSEHGDLIGDITKHLASGAQRRR